MTPNPPSGMTPKNPEPRQGLFGRIWARWQRIRQLMDHICAENNANVTRDYGTHTVDVSSTYESPPLLTADDLADAKRLLDVRVAAEEPANP